jgi:hypothetical protein
MCLFNLFAVRFKDSVEVNKGNYIWDSVNRIVKGDINRYSRLIDGYENTGVSKLVIKYYTQTYFIEPIGRLALFPTTSSIFHSQTNLQYRTKTPYLKPIKFSNNFHTLSHFTPQQKKG